MARWISNPDHKRAQRVVATEAGFTIKAAADVCSLAVAERLTEGLDVAVLRQAVTSLHSIREWLEADARSVAGGPATTSAQDDQNEIVSMARA